MGVCTSVVLPDSICFFFYSFFFFFFRSKSSAENEVGRGSVEGLRRKANVFNWRVRERLD